MICLCVRIKKTSGVDKSRLLKRAGGSFIVSILHVACVYFTDKDFYKLVNLWGSGG